MEFDLNAVDGPRFVGLLDEIVGWNQRRRSPRQRLAEAGVDLPTLADGQRAAELVLRAPSHGVAGDDVLGDRVVHEAIGRDHLDLARLRVFLRDDTLPAAEVIGMAVGVDHRDHRLGRPVLEIEFQRRLRGLVGQHRID